MAEAVNLPNLNYIVNDEYETTDIVYSLYKAKSEIDGPVIISFEDVLYENHIIAELLSIRDDDDVVLGVDISWANGRKKDRTIGAVIGIENPSVKYLSDRCIPLKKIGEDIPHEEAYGEWIGVMK